MPLRVMQTHMSFHELALVNMHVYQYMVETTPPPLCINRLVHTLCCIVVTTHLRQIE